MGRSDDENFTTYVEEIGRYTYIGKATRNSLPSASVWQIKRVEEVGRYTYIQWADGSDDFKKVWNDRSTYTYS